MILNSRMIQQLREQERMTEEEKEKEKKWSLEECKKRGCLPTGEPLDAEFGPDWE